MIYTIYDYMVIDYMVIDLWLYGYVYTIYTIYGYRWPTLIFPKKPRGSTCWLDVWDVLVDVDPEARLGGRGSDRYEARRESPRRTGRLSDAIDPVSSLGSFRRLLYWLLVGCCGSSLKNLSQLGSWHSQLKE